MKPTEVLRIVDLMQHEKDIDREIIFEGIQAALQLAVEKRFGEESGIVVTIDRDSGAIQARKGEEEIEPSELGRIAAQSAKQVMIQKIREAESNQVFQNYAAMKGTLVHGPITRHEGGAAIVSLGKTEAILPRSEQIPGETHHVGERIKAVVLDVKRAGHRVKIILSRTHPDFVRCLFENEIPEIADRTIEIKALAREAGYRAKIAVSSIDLKVDCVGACVGVRGSRIKNVVDELGGERIDIVRWNDSLQVMIPNALQPAQVDEVFLYPRLGRAIVLVKEDQLSLAIGRRGQNVRLASKLVGWDIEIMTIDELNESIDRAQTWFVRLPGATDEMIERFIEEGFLSFDDVTFVEPSELAELGGIDEDLAQEIIDFAEDAAERVDEEIREAKAAEEGRALAAHHAAAAAAAGQAEASAEGGAGEASADAQSEAVAVAEGEQAAGEQAEGEQAAGEPLEGEPTEGADETRAALEQGEVQGEPAAATDGQADSEEEQAREAETESVEEGGVAPADVEEEAAPVEANEEGEEQGEPRPESQPSN